MKLLQMSVFVRADTAAHTWKTIGFYFRKKDFYFFFKKRESPKTAVHEKSWQIVIQKDWAQYLCFMHTNWWICSAIKKLSRNKQSETHRLYILEHSQRRF